jgi:hypothetical protein
MSRVVKCYLSSHYGPLSRDSAGNSWKTLYLSITCIFHSFGLLLAVGGGGVDSSKSSICEKVRDRLWSDPEGMAVTTDSEDGLEANITNWMKSSKRPTDDESRVGDSRSTVGSTLEYIAFVSSASVVSPASSHHIFTRGRPGPGSWVHFHRVFLEDTTLLSHLRS